MTFEKLFHCGARIKYSLKFSAVRSAITRSASMKGLCTKPSNAFSLSSWKVFSILYYYYRKAKPCWIFIGGIISLFSCFYFAAFTCIDPEGQPVNVFCNFVSRNIDIEVYWFRLHFAIATPVLMFFTLEEDQPVTQFDNLYL